MHQLTQNGQELLLAVHEAIADHYMSPMEAEEMEEKRSQEPDFNEETDFEMGS